MKTILSSLLLVLLASVSHAQGTEVRFGAIQQDTTAPVEVTADNLSIDQDSGKAVFAGDVLVAQGALKLSADQVEVTYATDGTGISALTATGKVTLASDTDAAEADQAEYNVADGTLIMSGGVFLTQGPTILGAERMQIDLNAGTAQLQGRVRTVIQQGNN
jgi:lipopolysaccharide export system protein LptA